MIGNNQVGKVTPQTPTLGHFRHGFEVKKSEMT